MLKRQRKVNKLIAKGMVMVLAAGSLLCGNPIVDSYGTDVSAKVIEGQFEEQENTFKAMAGKKTSALAVEKKKAEKKLLKTYDKLAAQSPYSKANFKRLTSIKNTGVKKINSAKKKNAAGKTAEKFIKKLKAVKNLLKETGEDICVGDNGVVAWKPVKGAKEYIVSYVYLSDNVVSSDGDDVTITNTFTKVKTGYGVQVKAVNSAGKELEYYASDYYDKDRFLLCNGCLKADPVVDESKLSSWDAFEKIYTNSVKKNADGSVTFEVAGPKGERIKFWGDDIDVDSSSITLHENGRVMMTDGVGRIYSLQPVVSDPGDSQNWLFNFGGYNIDYDMHPKTIDRMIYTAASGLPADCYTGEAAPVSMAILEPNFAGVGVFPPSYDVEKQEGDRIIGKVVVDKFIIKYMPTKECTRFRDLLLYTENYGAYLEGDRYDKTREVYAPYEDKFYFTLFAVPDLKEDKNEIPVDILKEYDTHRLCVSASDGNYFKIGDIYSADGKKLDKDRAKIEKGTTLKVQLGKKTFDVELEVLDAYKGAKTFHDLIPYAFPAGTGQRNALVVPIVWQDETSRATDEALNEIKSELGRVAKIGSKDIKDYSDGIKDDRFSLSQYFDIASYGKIKIDSYITDWYKAPYDFSEMKNIGIDWEFIKEVMDWVYKKYPKIDFSEFDLDSNGYLDQVVFINVGDMSKEGGFKPDSFGGAVQYRNTYGNEYAGTKARPAVNNVVNMNTSLFYSNTLLHEFSHGFGLIDYYDVTYSGINAVGGYDMQSDSMGDWNAYSKYAAGWLEPTIVSGLNSGESREITIGALAECGDAIVIPAAMDQMKPPFSEYMLVDLYTSTGVNKYDSKDYDINDFTGVRIYHVDARMERRDWVNVEFPDMDPCPIGTIHYANDGKESGYYNIELIQAGAVNTFTGKGELRTNVQKEDFFTTGDIFTMEKYSEFFNDGLMDSGDEFGYTIEVVSVSGIGADAQAVIRVTKK